MVRKQYTQSEIIDFFREHFEIDSDNELAKMLGTNRQNVSLYRSKSQVNINTRLISLLISEFH